MDGYKIQKKQRNNKANKKTKRKKKDTLPAVDQESPEVDK